MVSEKEAKPAFVPAELAVAADRFVQVVFVPKNWVVR